MPFFCFLNRIFDNFTQCIFLTVFMLLSLYLTLLFVHQISCCHYFFKSLIYALKCPWVWVHLLKSGQPTQHHTLKENLLFPLNSCQLPQLGLFFFFFFIQLLPLYSGHLYDLSLHRSCACWHSCCEFIWVIAFMSGKHPVTHHLWLLPSFYPLLPQWYPSLEKEGFDISASFRAKQHPTPAPCFLVLGAWYHIVVPEMPDIEL